MVTSSRDFSFVTYLSRTTWMYSRFFSSQFLLEKHALWDLYALLLHSILCACEFLLLLSHRYSPDKPGTFSQVLYSSKISWSVSQKNYRKALSLGNFFLSSFLNTVSIPNVFLIVIISNSVSCMMQGTRK